MNNKADIFGDFKQINENPNFFFQGIAPQLHNVWQRCNLLSNYCAVFVSQYGKNSKLKGDIEQTLSYVLNEILENVAKFSILNNESFFSCSTWILEGDIIVDITNVADENATNNLRAVVKQLFTEDINDLYIKKLEENASQDDEANVSGLGFFSLINDHGVDMRFKFAKNDASSFCITTQSKFAIDLNVSEKN